VRSSDLHRRRLAETDVMNLWYFLFSLCEKPTDLLVANRPWDVAEDALSNYLNCRSRDDLY
jgi:hypothetical protein